MIHGAEAAETGSSRNLHDQSPAVQAAIEARPGPTGRRP
jgi:hypothetical protein